MPSGILQPAGRYPTPQGKVAHQRCARGGRGGFAADETTDRSRSDQCVQGMTHDVDADWRRAEQRPLLPDHAAADTPAAPYRGTAAPPEEGAAALRLRALQPARRATDPARSGQALHRAVPLAALAGAAQNSRGAPARRRTARLARPVRLADAARALDPARSERQERHAVDPRHRHARLDRSDRALPHDECPVERARDAGRARPGPGRAGVRHQGRLPHVLRPGQGAPGDGDEDPRSRGPHPAPRADARLAARRGRRPRGEGGLCPPRGAPLLPQGRPALEPGQGRAPREDQARQLQRLARRARRRIRLLRLGRHRSRTAAQLPGADARLLPRPGHRLRHRPAGLRQLRHVRHQGRRVPAVPLPRADPARGQPLRRPDVRRHQQRRPDIGPPADRRPVRLDHRGHGDRLRDAPRPQPAHRPELALGVHPGRAGRRRGPDRVDGLLHPAAALVTGDVRNDPQSVLERDRRSPSASSSTTR